MNNFPFSLAARVGPLFALTMLVFGCSGSANDAEITTESTALTSAAATSSYVDTLSAPTVLAGARVYRARFNAAVDIVVTLETKKGQFTRQVAMPVGDDVAEPAMEDFLDSGGRSYAKAGWPAAEAIEVRYPTTLSTPTITIDPSRHFTISFK